MSLNLALVISGEASGAKAAAAATGDAVQSVGRSAADSEAQLARYAAANDQAAASQRRVVDILVARTEAERNLRAVIDRNLGIGSAVPLAGTAFAGDRARGEDVAEYGRALDALRARYNPLFAEISRYRTVQADIRQAHALGAISADEMARAIDRERGATLQSIAAIKGRNAAMRESPAAAGGNAYTSNITAQFQDIAVTSAMGMSPMQIALQQGTQLSLVLEQLKAGGQSTGAALAASFTGLVSPISLVTIGLTGLTAYAIQYFTSAGDEADRANQMLAAHGELIGRLRERYGEAVAGLQLYSKESSVILQADLERAKESYRSTLSTGAEAARDAILAKSASEIGEQTPLFKPLLAALDELDLSLDRGDPKFKRFIETLAEFEVSPYVTESQKEMIRSVRDLETTTEGLTAERALGGLATLFDQSATAAFNGAKSIDQFADAMARLQKIGINETPALSALRDAITSAEGPFQRQAAIRAYDEAVERERLANEAQRDPLTGRSMTNLPVPQFRGVDDTPDPVDPWEAMRAGEKRIEDIENARVRRMNQLLVEQVQLWGDIRETGTDAIDRIVDSATTGFKDIGDVIKSIADDILKDFLKLAVANPLKNALYGGDLPTLDKAGGIGGFFNILAGGVPSFGTKDGFANALGATSNVTRLLTGANGNGGGSAPAGYGEDLASNITTLANNIGAKARDVAALMSFESGLRPDIWGGAGGRHFGLIQAGPNERSAYGITPGGSLADQFGGIERYFLDRGFKPGMGMMDLYSTVNAGRPGRYGASDAANGGTWGTVADKVNYQMGAHFERADKLLSNFADSTRDATGGLDKFGSNLANALTQFPAAPSAPGGGGFLSKLFGGVGGGLSSAFAGTGAFNWLSANPGGYIGLYANGTEGAPPGWAWVGEEGPELMKLRGGETIRSNSRSTQMAANANRPVINVQHVVHNSAGADVRTEQTEDSEGNIRMETFIDRQVASAINRRGSATEQSLRARGINAPRPRR